MKKTIISEKEKGTKLVVDVENEARKYILVFTIEPGYSVFYLFARDGNYHQDVFEKFLEEKKDDIIFRRKISKKELIKNGRHIGAHVKVRGGGWIDFVDNKIILSGRSGQYGYAKKSLLEEIQEEAKKKGIEIVLKD